MQRNQSSSSSSARSVAPLASGDLSGALTRGVAGGLFAGAAFILANMWYAVSQGNPAVGPFWAISTIFHGSDLPVPSPENLVIGLVTHLALSMSFGIGFALLLWLVPMLRGPLLLTMTALVYGVVLYLVNFQVLGRTAFPFFTDSKGPNQVLELLAHPLVFGLFLVPFFLGWGRTRHTR
ncbi:hypothetical protein [Streptomyces sp. NPDC048142]|uniref:hypothetical protein n=1 Tax=Streptomyces sp. NPDC048142 TaxID=3365501 RepID=UPI003717974D